MLRKLYNDESGVIISAELVLVLTIAVLAMIVGLSEVAVAVNLELNDLSSAFGALNQSYTTIVYNGADTKAKWFLGSSIFVDGPDDCDCNTTCQIVGNIPTNTGTDGHTATP